jgi:hypothetical protein
MQYLLGVVQQVTALLDKLVRLVLHIVEAQGALAETQMPVYMAALDLPAMLREAMVVVQLALSRLLTEAVVDQAQAMVKVDLGEDRLLMTNVMVLVEPVVDIVAVAAQAVAANMEVVVDPIITAPTKATTTEVKVPQHKPVTEK